MLKGVCAACARAATTENKLLALGFSPSFAIQEMNRRCRRPARPNIFPCPSSRCQVRWKKPKHKRNSQSQTSRQLATGLLNPGDRKEDAKGRRGCACTQP